MELECNLELIDNEEYSPAFPHRQDAADTALLGSVVLCLFGELFASVEAKMPKADSREQAERFVLPWPALFPELIHDPT